MIIAFLRIFPHIQRLYLPYEELGAIAYDTQQRERELTFLRKKAAKLGAVLILPDPAPTLTPTLSG
jgi:hypothetical protein